MIVSWHRISALLLKYWYMSIRILDRWADVFFWPVVSIFLWGFVTLFLETDYQVNVIGLILMGFIFYQFFQRCQTDIPLYLLEDFWSNNLANVYSTPITKWDTLISLVIIAICKALLSVCVTVAIAYFMFSFSLFDLSPLYLGMYLFSLMLFSIGLGILLSGVIFRVGTQFQVIAWSTSFLLQPFMAVFYPVNILPLWMQQISTAIPATYVFEGLRKLKATGIFDTQGYIISIVLNCIFVVIACAVFAIAFNHNKKQGKMVHSE